MLKHYEEYWYKFINDFLQHFEITSNETTQRENAHMLHLQKIKQVGGNYTQSIHELEGGLRDNDILQV